MAYETHIFSVFVALFLGPSFFKIMSIVLFFPTPKLHNARRCLLEKYVLSILGKVQNICALLLPLS